MKRVGAVALLLSACSADSGSYRVDVITPDDVRGATREWMLSFFEDVRCESLALVAGGPDLVRTSTPAVRRRVAAPEALGDLDLADLAGTAALDVRALDEDGTPLAGRCVDLSRYAEAGRFHLYPLAPAGATLVVEEPFAVRAGTARRDVRVRVRDAAGHPLAGITVSTGAAHPLSETDADGLAQIGTPTTTVGLDTPLYIEAYGIPGPTTSGHAAVLRDAPCPERVYGMPLSGGSASLTRLAGTNDVVAVLIPRTAQDSVIEIYRSTGGRAAIERVATATSAGTGPLSIAEDRRDGSFVLAVGAQDGAVHLHRFDSRARTVRTAGTVTASAALAGPLSSFGILALLPILDDPFRGPSLLVAAPELTPRALVFVGKSDGTFGSAQALLPTDDRTPTDLVLADLVGDRALDLVITEGEALAVHEGRGDGSFAEARRVSNVSGRIGLGHFDGDHVLDMVVVDHFGGKPSAHLVSVDASGTPVLRSTERLPAAGDRPLVGDLNGDDQPDLLVLGDRAGSTSVLLGDGRGHLLPLRACAELEDTAGGHPIDLDRDGRLEWVTLVRDAREIAVLALAK